MLPTKMNAEAEPWLAVTNRPQAWKGLVIGGAYRLM